METIVGIFQMREDAMTAARGLRSLGFGEKNVIVLYPNDGKTDVEAVPSEDAEQPGMGKTIGGVVGGAAGLSAGAVIAGLIPGVGPVVALTFGAVAAGIGAAVAGAAAGGALEEVWTKGVPKDEVFFYEDALRQGRTILVALSEDAEQLESGRRLIEKSGAESLNAAREKWWIGLRDVEEVDYTKPTDSRADVYRRGFEAALEPESRGRSLEQMKEHLQKRHPHDVDDATFRDGFEHGRRYYEKIAKQSGEAQK
ncbi:MAG TPA: hypothetical protein VEG60_07185 [Candidatus Binatia bacterium]|nr:hypothetical protein [Candidatus Binatia bacterium]